ncbi:hypothetical protein ACHAWF_012038 [Thalassiosira exigua]
MSDNVADRLRAAKACLSWIDENGGDVSLFKDGSLEFRESPRGGIGLFVTRSMPMGEKLMYVPVKCVLNWKNVSKSSFFKRIGKEVVKNYTKENMMLDVVDERIPLYFTEHNVRMFIILFVLLICNSDEKTETNQTSSKEARELQKITKKYRFYLATLPKSVEDGALSWTDAELACINDTLMQRDILTFRRFVDNIWTKVVSPMLEETNIAPAIKDSLPSCNEDRLRIFRTAVSLVTSRHWGSGESFHLMPAVDLINGAVDGSRECNTILADYGVFTSCDVQDGAEIIDEYGEFRNTDFISKYGFCPSSNVHDKVDIWIPERLMVRSGGDERWNQIMSSSGISECVVRAGIRGECSYPYSLPANSDKLNRIRKKEDKIPPDGVVLLYQYVSVMFPDEYPSDKKKKGFIISLFDAQLERLALIRRGLKMHKNPSKNLITAQTYIEHECNLMLQWRCALMSVFGMAENPKYSYGPLELLNNEDHCLVCCGILKLRKCTRCKKAKYCSKKCQREDWGRHKAFCTPI